MPVWSLFNRESSFLFLVSRRRVVSENLKKEIESMEHRKRQRTCKSSKSRTRSWCAFSRKSLCHYFHSLCYFIILSRKSNFTLLKKESPHIITAPIRFQATLETKRKRDQRANKRMDIITATSLECEGCLCLRSQSLKKFLEKEKGRRSNNAQTAPQAAHNRVPHRKLLKCAIQARQ